MDTNTNIDDLIYAAVFSADESVRLQKRQEIRLLAKEKNIFPASILPLYRAFGKNQVEGFTVPAINIRFLTYDTARIIFRLMKEKNIGPVIFEIAKSEQIYTGQNPDEYATAVLAAAIKEEFSGPVFLQGDHYQFSSKEILNPKSQIQKLQELIKDSIEAGFYNIDIDASTLVDLEKINLEEQQKNNYEMTALLAKFIVANQPSGIEVSIGGEIGHIGGKNSTIADFEAFMKGFVGLINPKHEALNTKQYQNSNDRNNKHLVNLNMENSNLFRNSDLGFRASSYLSKISVQTGTSHGGVIGSDGHVLPVNVDFSVLEQIGQIARENYGLGGAVQHGASTLSDEMFDKFPQSKTLEVHLSTGWQNIVFDHLPLFLKNETYQWIKTNCTREGQWTEEQFYYKMRKKTAGPFKEKMWNMTLEEKKPILEALEAKFRVIFEKLRVFGTKEITEKYFVNPKSEAQMSNQI